MAFEKQRIAFFKNGTFSHINYNIEHILRERFPNNPLDVIDIKELVKPHKRILLINLLSLTMDYGYRIAHTRDGIMSQYFRTTYLIRQIKRLASEILDPDRYLFSFQTQSLFDASVPGLPHFVYTDHAILANLEYPGYTPRQLNALYPPSLLEQEKSIYRNATITFTMGRFVARNLIRYYGCDSNQVIYAGGGSNTAPVIDSEVKEYTNKNIVFVGVDWQRKGGPELAAAFAQLLDRHPNASLTIVGCSPEIDLPNCRTVGKIPLEKVQPYYNAASIFCMPSRREPFGVAFIEASMNRLPVVSTCIGAIPDIILDGETGFLIEPGNVEALVGHLDKLLCSPPLCRQFGDAGSEHVRRHFTWHTVGDVLYDNIEASLKQSTRQLREDQQIVNCEICPLDAAL